METESGFNPATMAMEARCKRCGALVASVTKQAMTAARLPAGTWFTLVWNGSRNHEEAGCHVNGTE